MINPWDEILAVTQGSEGDVEVRVVSPLLRALDWRQEVIFAKETLTIRLGRQKGKQIRGVADFIVYTNPQKSRAWLIVEAKKPDQSLDDAVEQGKTYADRVTAPYLLIVDGLRCAIYRRTLTGTFSMVLSHDVQDIRENQDAWRQVIGPQAVQAFLARGEENHELFAMSRWAHLSDQRNRIKCERLAEYITAIHPDEAQTFVTQHIHTRNPWLDRFEKAQTLNEYRACLNEHQFQIEDSFIEELVVLDNVGVNRTVLENMRSLSNITSAAPVNVADESEQGFGEESVLLRQLGIPMFTQWTKELDQLFSPVTFDTVKQFINWFRADLTSEPQVELKVIRYALRGEYGAALDALERWEIPDHLTPMRQIARSRLLGTLYRLQGDSGRARTHYLDAKRQASKYVPNNLWLKRRMMYDLNPLREINTSEQREAFFQAHQDMLDVLAWYGHPVIDASVRSMLTSILKEVVAQQTDRPTASRSSTYFEDAFQNFIKALFFAFASGDYAAIQEVTRLWAHALTTMTHPPLSYLLELLWEVGEERLLVDQVAQQPQAAYEALKEKWDTWLTQRPAYPEGQDAQVRHLLILRLIPLLAPYLKDETVQSLRAEFVTGLVEHHQRRKGKTLRNEYTPVPMIEGQHFSITYALEALKTLDQQLPLTMDELEALSQAVQGQPYSDYGAWVVLSGHVWTPVEHHIVQKLIQPGITLERLWLLNEWTYFLYKLAQTYPDDPHFTDVLISYLLDLDNGKEDAFDSGLLDVQRWNFLLNTDHPDVSQHIKEHAFQYFHKQVQALQNATGQESYSLNALHPIRSLSHLFERHANQLSLPQKQTLLSGLIQAALNTNLPLHHKRDLLITMEQTWPHLTSKQRAWLKATYQQHLQPQLTQAQLRTRPGPGHAPETAPLHFRQLILHALMNLPLPPDSQEILRQTLTDHQAFNHLEALKTLARLQQLGTHGPDETYALLLAHAYQNTTNGSYALYLALIHPINSGQPWNAALRPHLDNLSTRPHHLNAVISAAEQLPVSHPLKTNLIHTLQKYLSHPDRRIRRDIHALQGVAHANDLNV